MAMPNEGVDGWQCRRILRKGEGSQAPKAMCGRGGGPQPVGAQWAAVGTLRGTGFTAARGDEWSGSAAGA
jgi:hypothetical protein